MRTVYLLCIITTTTVQKTLLRKLRREQELSLDLLRAKTGINVSTLSRVERGLIEASPEVKKRLSKFFKLPAEQLLSAAPNRTVAA